MGKAHFTREYDSASTYPVSFVNGFLPQWIRAVGAGVVTVENEDGTTGAFTVTGGEIITGQFHSLVSITCTRVWVGTGAIPPAPGAKGDTGARGATGPAGGS
jgi:hypothetical protein